MKPILSIHVATYNHKDFIRQSIESALNQKTNFEYEIVIGDDFSTDGTREILIEYQKKFPEKITLNLLKSKGEGMPGHLNFVSTLEKCSGDFIAFLDGDDYWTDENKLQNQYDILSVNSGYVMCHHDCSSERAEGIDLKRNFNKNHRDAGFYDACQITFPFFSSAMVRKNIIDQFDLRDWLIEMLMGDFPFWALITSKGDALFIDKKMAYYRRSATSYSSSFKYIEYIYSRIIFFEKLLKSSDNPDLIFTHRILSKYYFESSAYNLSVRNVKDFLKNFYKGIKNTLSGIGKIKKEVVWIDRLRFSSIFNKFFFGFLSFIKGKNNSKDYNDSNSKTPV